MAKENVKGLSDEQLVALAQEKNENAIEELFNRYKYIASSIAHSYFLNGGDSEDLLQEGLFAVFKAISSFNAKANFKTYVYTCVKNRIFSVIKSSNRYKNQPLNNYLSISGGLDGEEIDKSKVVLDSNFSPEETYINLEAENELKTKISQILSDYEYKILINYLKGYSYSELGKMFSKKEKSIDNAIQRIRKKILLEIQNKG